MDILLPQSVATTVEYYPPRRPTSATVRFILPDGSAYATNPTATVDPLSATIATVTDSEAITVSGVTGTFYAGRYYWWVSADGQESRVLLGQRDSTSLLLEWPVVRSVAEANDTLKGARITTSISALATATRGENYAIEWTTTCADGTTFVERQVAHVCRAQARAPCDVGFIKAAVVTSWPSVADGRSYGYFVDLTARVNDRVWRRIRALGRYVHLLWDASDMAAAARVALDRELAHDKLFPPGTIDTNAYKKELDAELDAEIANVYSSRPYDDADTGAATGSDIRPVNSIQMARV